MKLRTTKVTRGGLGAMAVALALTSVGCGTEGEEGNIDEAQVPVIAGTLSDPSIHPYENLFVRVLIGNSLCSGTLLGNANVGSTVWVLTARHCTNNPPSTASITVVRGATRIAAKNAFVHPSGLDAALIEMQSPMTTANNVFFTSQTPAQMDGMAVRCFGYGNSAWTDQNGDGTFTKDEFSGSGRLRYGDFVIKQDPTDTINRYLLRVPNAAGQALAPGDSGGACIKGSNINSTSAINLTGILKAGTNSSSTGIVTVNRQTAATAISDWVRTLSPRP